MNRALAASPLGFVVGLSVGALGSGGSIVAVPALVHVAGLTPKDATVTSLVMVGIASLWALPAHYRAGRVRWMPGVFFGLSGIAGSLAGTALNHRLDPQHLLLGFSVLILVAAWRMLTSCPSCTRVGERTAIDAPAGTDERGFDVGRVLLMVAAGTGIGFLTGLFGVGGGFVAVPVLTLLLRFAMPQAIGTSLVVVVLNSMTALAARIASSEIDWNVTLWFTVTAVAGVAAGARIADRIDAERSLRIFASALVLLALFTGGSAIFSMSGA